MDTAKRFEPPVGYLKLEARVSIPVYKDDAYNLMRLHMQQLREARNNAIREGRENGSS